MKRILTLLFLSSICFSASAFAKDDKVIVSIKPLHSLVAAVMQGDDNQPVLLVSGKESLHSYTLKPSQREAIEHAKVVFYIGDSFETFLGKTLEALPHDIQRVPMENLSELSLFHVRFDEDFEAHPEGKEAAYHHKKGGHDLHLWTMPQNAKVMVKEIARQLVIAFPGKKEIYLNNARQLANKLDQLDGDYEQRTSLLRTQPYIVFHDAIQYFERRYNLKCLGSITTHPEQGVSAKRLSEIRDKIKNAKAVCVFREPEFDGKVVDNLVAGTGAKTGVLDPEGALLTPGPDLYFQLMDGLVQAMESCLKKS